jgi:hypothetical protein
MNKRFLLAVSIASVATILFCSCQKNLQFKNKEDEFRETPLPGQGTYCRIESFWEMNSLACGERFVLILYDEYENPTAITVPRPTTGSPYLIFKYDQWHRLREFIGDYGNGGFEFWHFYGFDLNGRIGTDTTYIFGALLDKPVNYVDRRIAQIRYDNQGRIIQISTVSDHGYSFAETFEYGADGNLIYPSDAGVAYDNHVNLNRTNDIWMFLARDYSINNPFNADAYNSAGFPTIINSQRGFQFLNTTYLLNHSQISYECKQAVW